MRRNGLLFVFLSLAIGCCFLLSGQKKPGGVERLPEDEHSHHHGDAHHHSHHEHSDRHHHDDAKHDHHHHDNPFAATMLVNYKGGSFMVETSVNYFVHKGVHYGWEHQSHLGRQPEEMAEVAKAALHNNADEDITTGEVVTVIAGYGLVVLDKDLKEWRRLEDQDDFGNANGHGTDCFIHNGKSLWAFSSTNTGEVLICNRGRILHRLGKPNGNEFDNPAVNKYFAEGGSFVPCDAVYSPQGKTLTVVIGYTPGDYALTAKEVNGQWVWSGAAWGGSEARGGIFSTAHGVQIDSVNGEEVVDIASRGHGRVFGFTRDGKRVLLPGVEVGKDYVQLPAGSNPCNIFVKEGHLFMPFLNPIAGEEKAPVYIFRDGEQFGLLSPGTYPGLELMVHMHGTCIIERDGELYAVTLSWRNGGENNGGKKNDGVIAIFKAVPNGKKA